MIIGKGAEIFSESIPGILIQLAAILSKMKTGGAVSRAAYVSLFVSTLTTDYVAASMTYDFDTDPRKRAQLPDFYGFVPDDAKKRATTFLSMLGVSAAQVLITSLLVVNLGSIAMEFALYYLVGDVVLFLLTKILRGDFTYYLNLEGLVCASFSLGMRTMVVVVYRFTSCIQVREGWRGGGCLDSTILTSVALQLRHSQEVGGLYFTTGLFLPLIGLVTLFNLGVAEGTLGKRTVEDLKTVAAILRGSLVFR